MNQAYSSLAQFYDESIGVDYGEWLRYLLSLTLRHHHLPKEILDLGCGTGNLSIPLAKRGYKVTAVDISREMIAVAQNKALAENLEIAFLVQDMRRLDLPASTFTTVVSGCDVVNYITTPEDLQSAFSAVNRVLQPGGLWLFDLNSARKLQETYGHQSYADLQSDYSYFWDNSYDWQQHLCQMELTFFAKTWGGLYERVTETHQQKLWWPQDIRKMAKLTGFTCLACYDFLSTSRWSTKAERWQFVLRKPIDKK